MASGGCYILKKILVLSLCVILIAAFTFAACSKKSDDKTTTNSKDTTVQADDLENNNNEYGLETEDVTDKDGKTVTDAKGKAVTTDVAVVYKKDKKGKSYWSIRRIAEQCNMSYESVRRAIKSLEDQCLIDVEHCSVNGKKNSNIYTVHRLI